MTLILGTNGNPAPLLMNGAHGLVILGQDDDQLFGQFCLPKLAV